MDSNIPHLHLDKRLLRGEVGHADDKEETVLLDPKAYYGSIHPPCVTFSSLGWMITKLLIFLLHLTSIMYLFGLLFSKLNTSHTEAFS